MAKASVLGEVVVAEDIITVTVYHTDYASFSRSVVPLANKAFSAAAHKAGGWSRANSKGDFAHAYDETREPHRCVSTITYTRLY
jgi:hypothetical protein